MFAVSVCQSVCLLRGFIGGGACSVRRVQPSPNAFGLLLLHQADVNTAVTVYVLPVV